MTECLTQHPMCDCGATGPPKARNPDKGNAQTNCGHKGEEGSEEESEEEGEEDREEDRDVCVTVVSDTAHSMQVHSTHSMNVSPLLVSLLTERTTIS